MAEKEYIRLARPRTRSGFQAFSAARSGLWLGRDHLLVIETTGYTETYKRFFFRDIQAITLRQTKGYLIANATLIPLAVLFVVLGFVTSDSVGRIVLWCIALLPAIPLAINLVRGQSCVCHVRTAVQVEEISALGSVCQALKILDRIRPLIAEAQGLLSREEIPTRLAELAAQNQPRLVVDDPNLPPRMVS